MVDPHRLSVPKYSVKSDFDLRVVSFITVKCRPVLIGEVSLETGYALATCEWHLERMVESGSLVRVDSNEWRRERGYNEIVVGYFIRQS